MCTGQRLHNGNTRKICQEVQTEFIRLRASYVPQPPSPNDNQTKDEYKKDGRSATPAQRLGLTDKCFSLKEIIYGREYI